MSECKADDLSCLSSRFGPEASAYCSRPIEQLSKYSFEWTDGLLSPKFTQHRWKDRKGGVITYLGDKIRYQNGFGAWQNAIYECDFDTKTKSVMAVRAAPGRFR